MVRVKYIIADSYYAFHGYLLNFDNYHFFFQESVEINDISSFLFQDYVYFLDLSGTHADNLNGLWFVVEIDPDKDVVTLENKDT